MKLRSLTALCLMFVFVLSSQHVSGKRIRTDAKTFLTKYTKQKRTYCLFQGHEILPGSKWSTPEGCLKCKCTKMYLECKPLTNNKKKWGKFGCF